ncbi:MAG: aminotransferase class V-fold PLP-dependent enzyme [Gammaproteobacteria bacterium]
MARLKRRELLKSATFAAGLVAVASASAPPEKGVDWNAVRDDFPWLKRRLWLSAADYHPISIRSLSAMERHLRFRTYGEGEQSSPFAAEELETKRLFAELINARPSEIAFVQSTTDGENIVIAGIRLGETKGNVVIDDLHYQASKFMYRMLEKEGLIELRVVRHSERNGSWAVQAEEMERAIDKNTKLVSLALVSNINGYLHDVRRTSEAAHRHGAYLYADIIQGAGAVPIDVQAMGIDFAACGAYKWLMGDFGFGFLYVREDLQERVVKRSRYGVRQYTSPNNTQADSQFTLRPGAARYETGSFSYIGGTCARASLQYIHGLGLANIRSHAKQLTDRLQKELPRLGYASLTPPDNETPIVSFRLPDYQKTATKLKKAFGGTVIALRRWEFTEPTGEVRIVPGMRISPSVYNNQGDIDRLLDALA